MNTAAATKTTTNKLCLSLIGMRDATEAEALKIISEAYSKPQSIGNPGVQRTLAVAMRTHEEVARLVREIYSQSSDEALKTAQEWLVQRMSAPLLSGMDTQESATRFVAMSEIAKVIYDHMT